MGDPGMGRWGMVLVGGKSGVEERLEDVLGIDEVAVKGARLCYKTILSKLWMDWTFIIGTHTSSYCTAPSPSYQVFLHPSSTLPITPTLPDAEVVSLPPPFSKRDFWETAYLPTFLPSCPYIVYPSTSILLNNLMYILLIN